MADNREAAFTVSGAKRIVAQVRWAEIQNRTHAQPLPGAGPIRFEFWAVITDSVAWDSNPNKWWYSWKEQRLNSAGVDWEDFDQARTGDKDAATAAVNGYEANNPATFGLMGNGVDTSATDITLQPFPPNLAVVRMYVDFYPGDDGWALATYSFSEPNPTTCGSY